MSKRNIKVAAKSSSKSPAKPVIKAEAQAAPTERRAASRKVANTRYEDGAAYPFAKLSAQDRLYVSLFAAEAKAHGGQFSTSALDLAEKKPAGISVTNNRARAHRLVQGGFLTRKSDDVFEFVGAVRSPVKGEKRPNVLEAVTLYAKA